MQFLLYCICGGTGVLFDFSIFYAVLTLTDGYQLANAAGYLAGTLLSFFLNRKITFNTQDQTGRRLALFLCIAGIGYAVSTILLWIMVNFFTIDPKIAKIITLPVVVALQFSLNKLVTFRQSVKSSS